MSQVRKLATAAGTFSVALGIGFVMQNGDALAARMNNAEIEPVIQPTQAVIEESSIELPELPNTSTASFLPVALSNTVSHDPMYTNVVLPIEVSAPVVPDMQTVVPAIAIADEALALVEVVAAEPLIADPATPLLSDTCAPVLTAIAAPAATVALEYRASCAPNAVVTFHHQGMMFDVMTDATGQADVVVPALSETAVFMADMNGLQGAVATVSVSDIAQFDRAILQTEGDMSIMLHAREFGANTAEDGHVWRDATRDVQAALAGSGGYFVELGDGSLDGARMAQVYTYPSGLSSAQGAVALSIEAEVTAGNCGQNFTAQTIQISPGSQPMSMDLDVTLPACDGVGTFLVLNNLLTDLTLAAR